ncbi:MAG: hypothetical protein IJG02_01410, partial [Thermoguttaceae bacterium]|nr:hypothetical protein [Thermoguttaceae bacterium]
VGVPVRVTPRAADGEENLADAPHAFLAEGGEELWRLLCGLLCGDGWAQGERGEDGQREDG